MTKVDKTNGIDINKNYVYQLDKSILKILLKDHSSNKNIIWATDTYVGRGSGYEPQDYITVKSVTGLFGNVIKPSIKKSKTEQKVRIKSKAEVLTPSWLCNKQNNLTDNAWFGRENVFNTETEKGWTINYQPITFANVDGKTWQDYVKANRLELACGEAPYLVSRYDTVTGEWLEVGNRIGLLDRKLRVVCENVDDENDWVKWAFEAFKATYGYEWQGDSVLLARENLLFTFIDYYAAQFGKYPDNDTLTALAKIIAWNVWQMDGVKFVIPESCAPRKSLQTSIFDDETQQPQPCEGCTKNNPRKHRGIYCRVMDWQAKKALRFVHGKISFDAVVGNPPYQQLTGGAQAQATPLYHLFVEAAKAVSPNYISMVMPSRWFTGGFGLDAFRERMLRDDRLSVIHDFSHASECFANVEIKGGVCYVLWEKGHSGNCKVFNHRRGKEVSCVERPLLEEGNSVFIRHNAAISILRKVKALQEDGFNQLVSSQRPFGLPTNFKDCSPTKTANDDVTVYGNKFVGYLTSGFQLTKGQELLQEYKLFTPKAVGSGRTDDILKPILGAPNSICTETYVAIGPFASEAEAKNAMSYINTKLFHFLLTLKKNTQDCLAGAFVFIPMQDFSKPWTDDELYAKYSINDDEILIIEEMVNDKVGTKHDFKRTPII